MDAEWFERVLYPFQDEVLAAAARVDTGLYLAGGTALRRVHIRHRYSEDLDLFVNDNERFPTWVDRLLEAWRADGPWQVQVQRRDPRFVRAVLSAGELPLKIEFVNDVRGRVGMAAHHHGFGLVDTTENVLANKITALLDREEPKDLADIWALCRRGGLVLRDALAGASKAAGVFAADVARVLLGATASSSVRGRELSRSSARSRASGPSRTAPGEVGRDQPGGRRSTTMLQPGRVRDPLAHRGRPRAHVGRVGS